MFSYLNEAHTNSVFPSLTPIAPQGYSTNNVYTGFPPLMSDGRSVVSSFQPESFVDDQLKRDNGISSNWQYRKYLTQNAKDIMERNFKEAASDIGYYVNTDGWVSAQSVSSGITLHSRLTDKSDLKQMYLSREELEARRHGPILTQSELLQLRGK